MLAVGLSLLFILIPFGIDTPKKVKYAALSPLYYPQIVSLILCIIGVAIMFKNRQISVERKPDDIDTTHPNSRGRILSFLALLAIYSLTLDFLGFILGGIVALICSLLLAGERRPLIIVSIAVMLPLLLFLFFYKVAHVPMPSGLLAPIIRWI